MSLIVASVHEKHALLVTDTRACINDRPVSDEIKKVYPLPAGGFIASGPGTAWGAMLFEELKKTDGTLEGMLSATREWAPGAMDLLWAVEPDHAGLVSEKQASFVIATGPEGLYAAKWDWQGEHVQVGCLGIGVPDSVSDMVSELSNAYGTSMVQIEDTMKDESPMVVAGELLRGAATFVQTVVGLCGSQGAVGPNIEAGVIVQTAPGIYQLLRLERQTQQAVVDCPSPETLTWEAYA